MLSEVQRFKEERRKNVKQEDTEVQDVISRVRASRPRDESAAGDFDDDDEVRHRDLDNDDDDSDTRNTTFASPACGRGRGSRRPARGRGESSRRGGRGRGGRGRASSSSTEESLPSTSRGSKNTRSIKDALLMVPSSKRSNISASTRCV